MDNLEVIKAENIADHIYFLRGHNEKKNNIWVNTNFNNNIYNGIP